MLGGCFRVNAVKAVPASVARRRQKSQAIKNPKEINFAWGFSVLVVPGTESNYSLEVARCMGLVGLRQMIYSQIYPLFYLLPLFWGCVRCRSLAFPWPAPACCQVIGI
jgi:hypothetical protein